MAEPFIIDHTCTDLSQITASRIDAAQADIKTYYAHTSHGRQLTIGLEIIASADTTYAAAIGDNSLPGYTDRLCIYDYIGASPYFYWSSSRGIQQTRDVLNSNPDINVSMWSWCGEPAELTAVDMQEYLDVMAGLEAANPGVVFIYMTGHAQFDGARGYNRYQRNEQIRAWVRNSTNRVLFDFADLDSWWFDSATSSWEQATYEYANTMVPVEHPRFNDPSGPGHTTYESCEKKGRALWWMMAAIAGGDPGGGTVQPPVPDEIPEQLPVADEPIDQPDLEDVVPENLPVSDDPVAQSDAEDEGSDQPQIDPQQNHDSSSDGPCFISLVSPSS